jgi:hypothetical protein
MDEIGNEIKKIEESIKFQWYYYWSFLSFYSKNIINATISIHLVEYHLEPCSSAPINCALTISNT